MDLKTRAANDRSWGVAGGHVIAFAISAVLLAGLSWGLVLLRDDEGERGRDRR
ncbi:hypothetical protein NKH77_31945 [Streptomyces sp. M19]